MKFQIVHSDNLEDFLQKVQEALENGWELHGGPVSTHVWVQRPTEVRMGSSTPQRTEYLVQALVMHEEPGFRT